MKMLSMIRLLCLSPFIVIYGAWLVFKFALGLSVLIVAAWLMHTIFGKAGDIALALPFIYGLTFLLPNPQLGDFCRLFQFKNKARNHQPNENHSNIVEIKHFQRKVKP